MKNDNRELYDCLTLYTNCYEKVTPINSKSDPTVIFLNAKWYNRNENYLLADSLFKSLQDKILDEEDQIIEDYVISRLNNQIRCGDYSTAYLDQIVDKLSPSEYGSFYIRLLLEKSDLLREQGEDLYSFVCGYQGLYFYQELQIKDELLLSEIYSTIGINLFREYDTDEHLFYLKKATNLCNENDPNCIKLKAMLISTLPNNETNLSELQHFLSTIKNFYAPEIERLINTSIGWMLDDPQDKIPHLTNSIDTSLQNYCSIQLYAVDYLISAHIASNNIDSATLYHIQYFEKCNAENSINAFLGERQKQRIAQANYKLTLNKEYLKKGLQSAISSRNVAHRRFSDQESFHFADFLQENLTDILNFYYQLQDEEALDNDALFKMIQKSRLDKIYSLYKGKVNNLSSSNSEMTRLSYLQQKIDSLELYIHDYRDTLLENLEIYGELYELYEEKYTIKKEMPKLVRDTVSDVSLLTYQSYLSKNNTQVFEWNASYDHYYLTYINPNKIEIKKFEKQYVDSLVTEFRTQVQNKSEKFSEPSFELYQTLFSDILDPIYKNIQFISDDNLNNLPIEALIIDQTERSYILDIYNVFYGHQFETYNLLSIKPKINALSYSDPKTLNNNSVLKYPELPLGYEESKNISELYYSSNFLAGQNLTKKNIYDFNEGSILHLSTHSFSNPQNYLDNYLIVRNKDAQAEKMYGFEVSNIKYTPPLVILSSCNSGTGANKFGAGTYSLSRNFIQSGSQSVIKSLWAVNEASTSELMVTLHQSFKLNNISEALTEAKQHIKSQKEYQHPYYWSGFVLDGNPLVELDH